MTAKWSWPPCVYRAPSTVPWTGSVRLIAAAAGGSASLPGPPVGYIRAYSAPAVVAQAALTGPFLVTLQPANLLLSNFSGAVATLNGSLLSMNLIGAGESIRYVNSHATGALGLTASYFDMPVGTITLVRQQLSAAPTIVIPAPPVGSVQRFVNVPQQAVAGAVDGDQFVNWVSNPDTIVHSVALTIGAAVIARNTTALNINAFARLTIDGAMRLSATDGPISAQLGAAVVTTPPVFYSAYETVAA